MAHVIIEEMSRGEMMTLLKLRNRLIYGGYVCPRDPCLHRF